MNVKEQTNLPAALLGLPRGAGTSGNPGGNGSFRAIGAQGF